MIPWFRCPTLTVAGLPIPVFGTTVTLAVITGWALAARFAPRSGLPRPALNIIAAFAVGCGLLGAHAAALVEHPRVFEAAPVAATLDLFNGLSSAGGYAAGFLGVLFASRWTRQPLGRTLDTLARGFPPALILGRLGCFLVHDHPGVRCAGPLSVAFPGGPRLDLALLEMIFVTLLWAATHLAPSRFRHGVFVLGGYAVGRLLLDSLRARPDSDLVALGAARDPRWLGLSLAQWLASAAVLLCVVSYATRRPGARRLSCP